EVGGADPGVAREIEVEGREARGGLRDVEGLGGVAQLLFEFLARGDVAQGADRACRFTGVVRHDVRTAGQAAHFAGGQQRAVFAFILGAGADRAAQRADYGLDVLRVHRRD